MPVTRRRSCLVGALALGVLPGVCSAATFQEGIALEKAHRPADAAQVFATLVRQNPRNKTAREHLAALMNELKMYDGSIKLWNTLIEDVPDLARYQLGLARALADSGKTSEARVELHKALGMRSTGAEDEYAAILLEGDLSAADGDSARARRAYRVAATMSAADPQEVARKLADLPARLGNRLDFMATGDHYTQERGNEASWMARYAYQWESGQAVYLRLDRLTHFHTTDSIFSVGGLLIPNRHFDVQAEVGVTQDAEFTPNEQVMINVDWTTFWIQPSFGFRYLDYERIGGYRILSPGLRFAATMLGDIEVRYEMAKDVDGTHTAITTMRDTWIFGGRNQYSFYVTGSAGKDSLPPEQRSKVKRFGTGVTWWPAERWAMRLDYGYQDRENDYTAHSVTLGFAFKF